MDIYPNFTIFPYILLLLKASRETIYGFIVTTYAIYIS